MEKNQQSDHLAAVIGAGPAGLFAARELANHGVQVVLINRDIKPGGLAEYGIYPDKLRMKDGLRNQFRQILAQDNIHYFGNITVGAEGDLTLADLRRMGVQAILVTAGAQGTKWLGLPGEDLTGVYHAKDLVYHYNLLPPFSRQTFHIGRKVAIVGMGNVMTDIAHYLIEERQVDEVITIARRGPGEIKFSRAEIQEIGGNLDQQALFAEIDQHAELMRSIGQDPEAIQAFFQKALSRMAPPKSHTHFTIRFLMSPMRILGDENGRVTGLEVQNNTLVLKGDNPRARGLDTYQVLDVDTVIFAIGDRVDEGLGLPVEGNEFCKDPSPRFPVGGLSYEVYEPHTCTPIPDIFVAGWSRQASAGLVGIARKDGEQGAQVVLQYLQTLPAPEPEALGRLECQLHRLKDSLVDNADLARLHAIERARAAELGVDDYKFGSNEEMLEALEEKPVGQLGD